MNRRVRGLAARRLPRRRHTPRTPTAPIRSRSRPRVSIRSRSLATRCGAWPHRTRSIPSASANRTMPVTPMAASAADSIAFGGGVPLYKGKTRVGGLGVSGDTACADHEIRQAHSPSRGARSRERSVRGRHRLCVRRRPSEFAHPLCDNTWRNGTKLGDEKKEQAD
ncbi:MAG: heme-binding protein [Vicinamibacterales bacterium]